MNSNHIFGQTFSRYIDLLSAIYNSAVQSKADRTGVGRISSYGCKLNIDLSDGVLPVETSRKIFHSASIGEMLWFLSGSCDVDVLKQMGGGKFWDNWSLSLHNGDAAARSEVAKLDSDKEHLIGSIGPMYGTTIRGSEDVKGANVDQFARVLMDLMHNPTSSRILMTTWFPSLIPTNEKGVPWVNVLNGEAALAPCHGTVIQFFVHKEGDEDHLSMSMYQRSADVPVGLVHNITQYGFLLHLVAYLTGYKPHMLMIDLGDAHIYSNQMELVKQHLSQEVYPYPKIKKLNPVWGFLKAELKLKYGAAPYMTEKGNDKINLLNDVGETITNFIMEYDLTGKNALTLVEGSYAHSDPVNYPVAV